MNLYKKISDFVISEVIPLESFFLSNDFSTLIEKLDKLREMVKKKGWWTPYLPKNDGGMGLSLKQFAEISEILGTSPLGHYVFNCQAPDIGNIELLRGHGSPNQKTTFLDPLVAGDIRSCFAMTEPDKPGSNPTWMDTTSNLDDNEYVINGRKWFTSSADGANFCIVMAVTNAKSKDKYGRASMFIVTSDNPGYEIVRNISVMGDSGEGYFSHSEIVFHDCRVPASSLLGNVGSGFSLAQERLGPGRIHHCMRWVGICERAFDLMCRHASSRELFPGHFLSNEGIIHNWISESRAEINAARLLVLDCATQIDQKGPYAARSDISIIKFYVSDVLNKILDRAIQTHGALGITDDTPLSFWYRHERGARIYDGADEVHKRSVAKQILKQYIDG